MEVFLLIVILILIGVVIHQKKEIHKLKCKTLDAFKIVCQKINALKENK